MMAPDLSEWLRMPEVAFEVFIGVHKDDKITCDRIGAVPRRLCADPQVDYIELAMNLPQAVDRAIQLFGNRCHLTSKSLFVLRVQFTSQGFAKYAAHTLGSESNYCPMLYKSSCSKNDSDMDRGAWAFHRDLPLEERAENRQVVIHSEWLEIV